MEKVSKEVVEEAKRRWRFSVTAVGVKRVKSLKHFVNQVLRETKLPANTMAHRRAA